MEGGEGVGTYLHNIIRIKQSTIFVITKSEGNDDCKNQGKSI